LVQPLIRTVKDLFAGMSLNTKVTAVHAEKNTVRVSLAGATKLADTTFDRVLVAIGRCPSSDNLGLETTTVKVDTQGYIMVDAQRRTADARIFAIGDVAGGMLLAHEALHEGRVAAEVIAGQPAAFDARAVPRGLVH
jgi:dihydrolipoamide dehydrogenase